MGSEGATKDPPEWSLEEWSLSIISLASSRELAWKLREEGRPEIWIEKSLESCETEVTEVMGCCWIGVYRISNSQLLSL